MVKSSVAAIAATIVALVLSAPAQAYDFDGFYVGLQAGWGSGSAEQPYHVPCCAGPNSTIQADAELDGWLAGGHAGFNWLRNGWVYGVEADMEWSDISGDDGNSAGDTNEFQSNWQGSLRARLGHTFNNETALFYITGGWAFLDADSNVTDPGEQETDSATFMGWTLGGGLEVSLAPSISGNIEYRYSEFGDEVVAFPTNNYSMAITPNTHVVRVGVSFDL